MCADGLPCAGLEWSLGGSQLFVTVVAKATFVLSPTVSPLAKQQEPLVLSIAPESAGPFDGAPFKHRAELLVIGSAYARPGEQVGSLVTRVRVGDLDKSVIVLADRSLGPDGDLVEGPPFSRMPLTWERTGRGPAGQNPLGLTRDGSPAQRRLPNLVPPATEPSRDGSEIAPACYAALPETFPSRRARAGGVTRGLDGSFALDPSVDPDFFQSAPRDQWQKNAFDAEPRLVLEHLHPQHARLSTNLAPVHVAADLERAGGSETKAMTADTLLVDTDRGLCTVTFRTSFPLARGEKGRVTVRSAASRAALEAPPPRRRPEVPSEIAIEDERSQDIIRLDTAEIRLDPESTMEAITSDVAALPFARAIARSAAPPLYRRPAPPPPPPSSPSITSLAGAPSLATSVLPSFDEAGLDALPRLAPLADPSQARRSEELLAGGVSDRAPAAAPPSRVSGGLGSGMPALGAPPVPPRVTVPPIEAPPPVSATPAAPPRIQMPSAPLAVHPERAVAEPSPPPPRVFAPVGGAAPESILAASDRAADPQSEKKPLTSSRVDLRRIEPEPDAPLRRDDPLELLFADERLPHDLQREPQFREVLSRARGKRSILEGPPAPVPEGDDVRSLAIRVLYDALPAEPSELESIAGFSGGRDRFDLLTRPPLVVLHGDLCLKFDEREALRATVGVAQPFVPLDRSLKDAVDFASAVLESEWSGAFSIDNAAARLRDALAKASKDMSRSTVEATIQRLLLERRKFKTARILGAERIRADLSFAEGRPAVVFYLPIELRDQLPLFDRLPIRALVEVRPKQDGAEAHPCALFVRAFARRLAARSGRL